MTEQEAAFFAERLTKVWVPEGKRPTIKREMVKGFLWVCMRFGRQVIFKYKEFDEGQRRYYWAAPNTEDGPRNGMLSFCTPAAGFGYTSTLSDHSQAYWDNDTTQHVRAQFANKWLPFFRRGLWLCGEDVEATFTERMEWAQVAKELGIPEEELPC